MFVINKKFKKVWPLSHHFGYIAGMGHTQHILSCDFSDTDIKSVCFQRNTAKEFTKIRHFEMPCLMLLPLVYVTNKDGQDRVNWYLVHWFIHNILILYGLLLTNPESHSWYTVTLKTLEGIDHTLLRRWEVGIAQFNLATPDGNTPKMRQLTAYVLPWNLRT